MRPQDWYKAVEGPAIVLAGAATGQNVEVYRRRWPDARYLLFEPCTAYHRDLARFANDPLVTVSHKALSDHNGDAAFHENHKARTSSLYPVNQAHPMGRWIGPGQETTVECDTLDRFCQENGIERIGLAELDAQGGELDILMGARGLLERQAIDCLLVEVFWTSVYLGIPFATEIDAFLKVMGYTCLGRLPHHQMERSQEHWGDMVYIRGAA